jgi:ubiquinone/menaquinone biosynthesis C-methylase UbiE
MPRQLHQPPKEERQITTGKTIHRARLYDLLGAILVLGRGPAMRERTIALAHLVPGESVLEVGCGTGEIAMRAKARSGPRGSVAGIDPSPEMIAVARQKAARANLDIDYRVASVEALPFADATFDVVLSSLMMHHLPEDLKPRALAEIRRVLKPGGRLLIVDFKKPASRLGRLAPIWLVHRRLPSDVRDLPGLLEAAGFAAVEDGPTGFSYLGFVHGRAGQ